MGKGDHQKPSTLNCGKIFDLTVFVYLIQKFLPTDKPYVSSSFQTFGIIKYFDFTFPKITVPFLAIFSHKISYSKNICGHKFFMLTDFQIL